MVTDDCSCLPVTHSERIESGLGEFRCAYILCSWWVMPTAGNSENASEIEQASIDKNLI